jgi:hypothetical protein
MTLPRQHSAIRPVVIVISCVSLSSSDGFAQVAMTPASRAACPEWLPAGHTVLSRFDNSNDRGAHVQVVACADGTTLAVESNELNTCLHGTATITIHP